MVVTVPGRTEQKIDPFVTEIIRSGIIATTDEMKTNLMKTSYTPTVYEALDFTVALTDSKGNLVSIGLGLPSFIRGIADTVKAHIKHFGDDINPGDMLLTNDAYTHGSHLNHMILALPIFDGDEIVGYACSEPHWSDIGGMLTLRTTDIYAEGLQLPFLKIAKKGVLDKQLLSIIESNVRRPDLAMGDFRGQIGCVKTGEKRVLHMVKKYGRETFKRSLDSIAAQAADFSRREVEKIPGGTYEAEQFLDDDGLDLGNHIKIKVKITVKGGRMTVDLSEMNKQVRGPFNSNAGVSGVQMGFKTIVCPTWFPVNDGSFSPLDVILPPGTVVSATRPAAYRRWMVMPMNIADTMWKALAPAIPNKIAAGHHGDLVGAGGNPIDPKTKRLIYGFGGGGAGLPGGGFGAKYDSDGMSAVICLNDGDTHNQPVESGEVKNNRVLILSKELRQDSGGPGKYRGGLGVVVEAVYFTDYMLNSTTDRSVCAPWGAQGAKPGLANKLGLKIAKQGAQPVDVTTRAVLTIPFEYHERPDATHETGKFSDMVLPAGSRAVVMSGGGGGFGNPLLRDPAKVRDDVFNGYVSVQAAERDYGVVIDPASKKLDVEATRKLREKLARA